MKMANSIHMSTWTITARRHGPSGTNHKVMSWPMAGRANRADGAVSPRRRSRNPSNLNVLVYCYEQRIFGVTKKQDLEINASTRMSVNQATNHVCAHASKSKS